MPGSYFRNIIESLIFAFALSLFNHSVYGEVKKANILAPINGATVCCNSDPEVNCKPRCPSMTDAYPGICSWTKELSSSSCLSGHPTVCMFDDTKLSNNKLFERVSCALSSSAPCTTSGCLLTCNCNYRQNDPFPADSPVNTPSGYPACKWQWKTIDGTPEWVCIPTCILQESTGEYSSSNMKVVSDVPADPSGSTHFPYDPTRKYIEFQWKPLSALRYRICYPSIPSANVVYPSQKIILDADQAQHTESHDANSFELVGATTNKFRIDYQKLACGEHKWSILSEASVGPYGYVHVQGNCPSCHYHYSITTSQSPVLTFTKDCCTAPPTVTINSPMSPLSGAILPSDTTSVQLDWTVRSSCASTSLASSAAYITPPGATVGIGLSYPVSGFNPAGTRYNSGPSLVTIPDTVRCAPNLSVARTYSWYAQAENYGFPVGQTSGEYTLLAGRNPASGSRIFTIAPNVVTVRDIAPVSCQAPGTALTIPFEFDDYNYLLDTFQFTVYRDGIEVGSFEASQGTSFVGTKCTTDSSLSPPRTTCNVTVPDTLLNDEGDYSIKIKKKNTCGDYGIDFLTDASSNIYSYNFMLGAELQGTLELAQDATSDFQLELYARIEGLDEYTSASIDFYETSYDETINPITTLPIGCEQPDTNFHFINHIDCTKAQLEATHRDPNNPDSYCHSPTFLPDVPGKYCYMAKIANVGVCGAVLQPEQESWVYLMDVHAIRDIDDNLSCNSDPNDRTTPDVAGTVALDGTPVVFTVSGSTSGFERDVVSGIARFGFASAPLGGNPTINVFLQCGECPEDDGDPDTPEECTPCVDAGECRSTFLDCAGSPNFQTNVDSDPTGIIEYFAPVPGTSDVLIYDQSLQLGTPSKYDLFLRVGTVPSPDDWLTVVDGDIYASGADTALEMCTETSFADATFDGGIIERPEGVPEPYEKDINGDGSLDDPADNPRTGGYFFTKAPDTNITQIDLDHLVEGDPVGRYVFSIHRLLHDDEQDKAFSDKNFGSFVSFNGLDLTIPSGVPTEDLDRRNDGSPDNTLQANKIYVAESDEDFYDLMNAGGYRLDGGAAIIYYTSDDPLVFAGDRGFRNLANSKYRVVIVSRAQIQVTNEMGYVCLPFSLDPADIRCGLDANSDGGIDSTEEYSPQDSFPGHIDATLVSIQDIDIDQIDDPLDTDSLRLLKVFGSLISGTEIHFRRSLGNPSLEYPAEMVRYDSNQLYELTKLNRAILLNGVPQQTPPGLAISTVDIKYGY